MEALKKENQLLKKLNEAYEWKIEALEKNLREGTSSTGQPLRNIDGCADDESDWDANFIRGIQKQVQDQQQQLAEKDYDNMKLKQQVAEVQDILAATRCELAVAQANMSHLQDKPLRIQVDNLQTLLGEGAERNERLVKFMMDVQLAMDTLEASKNSREKNYHLVKFLMAVRKAMDVLNASKEVTLRTQSILRRTEKQNCEALQIGTRGMVIRADRMGQDLRSRRKAWNRVNNTAQIAQALR
ncbi:hypothetical protein BR93DRAFT_963147 [Coniochaeta sp. PMI_546]|nr:hypothetical protein BR93DRAFT_963147 [Coniochaeta sp. PMI_546]